MSYGIYYNESLDEWAKDEFPERDVEPPKDATKKNPSKEELIKSL